MKFPVDFPFQILYSDLEIMPAIKEIKMEILITALGPVFAAGMAVQQLLELIGPWMEKWTNDDEKRKKLFLGLISLAVGLGISFGARLYVLGALGSSTPHVLDGIVSGLIISGGTEGINSVMKYLGYSKAKEKANAAKANEYVGEEALQEMA